ncbi:MAG: hypothetical protein ACO3A4_03745 [Silvanigrellaceae bacterium]
MRFGSFPIFTALAVSLSVHATFLLSVGLTDSSSRLPIQTGQSQRVVVKLANKQRESDSKTTPAARSNSKKSTSLPPLNRTSERRASDEKHLIDGEQPTPESIHNGSDSDFSGIVSEKTQSETEIDAVLKGVVQKLAAPCRSISLPLHWIRLKEFWPRRYRAEFEFRGVQKDNPIKLTRLVPEAEVYQALDDRIFKSFSSCLNEQFSKQDSGTLVLNGILTPEHGEAYSVLMEFSPGDTQVASQQGI